MMEQIDFAIGKLVEASLFDEKVRTAIGMLIDVNKELADQVE